MLIAAIITGIIALACGIAWLARIKSTEWDDASQMWIGSGFWVIGFIWVICFLTALNWQISSQQLSGYIYSSSDTRGFTTAHIRFSQNAGTDAQPEFCVKTNSTPGREIAKYVGTNTKVEVNIPSYFYFSNNPFACGTPNTSIKPSASTNAQGTQANE